MQMESDPFSVGAERAACGTVPDTGSIVRFRLKVKKVIILIRRAYVLHLECLGHHVTLLQAISEGQKVRQRSHSQTLSISLCLSHLFFTHMHTHAYTHTRDVQHILLNVNV